MKNFSIYRIPKYINNLPMRIEQIGIGRYIANITINLGIHYKISNWSIRFLKILLNPISYFKSLNYKKYTSNLKDLEINEVSKNLIISKSKLKNIDELIKHCREIYKKKKKIIEDSYVPPYYLLLNYNLNSQKSDHDLIDNIKPILKFAAQDTLIGLVAKHLKQIPIIAGITLNYTKKMKASEKPSGAQKFHRDLHDKSLMHLVIPIYDLDKNCGPFTYIDAITSDKIINSLRHKGGRIEDRIIYKFANEENIVKITGRAGQAHFMSPYYSIHCGGRVKKNFRLLLIISYGAPNLAVESEGFLNRKIFQEKLINSQSSQQEKNLLNIY